MRLADFAFVNQQLAEMLRNGQPLEGALRQLCGDMAKGRLRNELATLEQDLAAGQPLTKAIEKRDLPVFYKHMLRVGSQANDLPSVLVMMANYYNRIGVVWDKLKMASFYPIIVLVLGSIVSIGMASVMTEIQERFIVPDLAHDNLLLPFFVYLTWTPAIVLLVLLVVTVMCAWITPIRDRLKWILPVSRNTIIAQFSDTLALLLRRGCSLGDATRFMYELEGDSILGREMKLWTERIESGVVCLSAIGEKSKVLPPMFVWMLEQDASDLPSGLEQAAEMYASQAQRQTDLLMHAAGPCGLIVLGTIVACQIYPAIWWFTRWFDSMSLL